MALEDLTGTKYIDSLNSSNPTATDGVSEGDDHLRGIKNVLKTTFPNVSGAVTSTHTELNLLDGVTATVAELNELDASAAAVSNFTSALRTYLYSGSTAYTTFSAHSAITEAAYESVGPTGSGAMNIWTGMDSFPSTAKVAILKVQTTWTNGSASEVDGVVVAFRNTGSTLASPGSVMVNAKRSGSTESFIDVQTIMVPLDSSRRFDCLWDATANATVTSVLLYAVGFMA